MKVFNLVAALAVAGLLAMPASAVTLKYDVGEQFGDVAIPNTNQITRFAQDVADSVDTSGASTGISLTIQNDLSFNVNNGSNLNGTDAPAGDALAFFPDERFTSDSLYGHTGAFQNETRPSVEYLIAGLAANGLYDFTFFADRGNGGGDRSATYSVGGGSASLDVFENTSNVARVLGAQANASGELTLTIAPSATNDHSLGFFYLGAMEIATAIPEPASMLLMVLGGMSTLLARRRS